MFQKLLQPSEFARLLACSCFRRFSRWGFAAARSRRPTLRARSARRPKPAAPPIRGATSRLAEARYRANPKDADAALQYGKALRATGQKSQAVAVLEQATIAHPGNKALLAGYGRALADNGNFQQAFDVLGQAHTPRQSGLADPVGARRGARSARPVRGSAAILRQRAEDRA